MHLSGRRIAYVTMLAMLSLSIAGNVSHTYHLDPTPGIRSLVYAVAWPVMVWLGVELFVRVPWQAKASHHLVRWVGILLVAAIAALVSYRHLRGLLKADSEEWTVYTFGPLAVDGLMLMATLALLLTRSLPQADTAPRQTLAQRVATLKAGVTDTIEVLAAPKVARNLDLTPVSTITDAVTQVQEDLTQDLPMIAQDQDPTEVPTLVIPESSMSTVPLGPEVPPAAQTFLDAVQENRRTRTSVDYAKVARLVLELDRDQDVADRAGLTGTKTAQRTRRAVRLLGTTDDVAAIASTVKLPLTAVQTIAQELTR